MRTQPQRSLSRHGTEWILPATPSKNQVFGMIALAALRAEAVLPSCSRAAITGAASGVLTTMASTFSSRTSTDFP